MITIKQIKLNNEKLNHVTPNQIKKKEMGGACSIYGGEESSIQGFGREI